MSALIFLRRVVAMLLLAFHLHVWAATMPLLADHTHTAWGGLQGAPVDVMKFAQTPDGWLWMATAIGLCRYDGTGFERVDSVHGQRLCSNDIIGLMATRDGALWTGYRMGGASVFRKNGARHFPDADGLPAGLAYQCAPRTRGRLLPWLRRPLGARLAGTPSTCARRGARD